MRRGGKDDLGVLHLIAYSVDPARGGMQESVHRIADALAADGWEVVVYALDESAEGALAAARRPFAVVALGDRIRRLIEPYRSTGFETFLEEWTGAALLCLQQAIADRLERQPRQRHLLLSFYATNSGFIAQHVAARLSLPHIASFRGSDCARDLVGIRGHSRIRFVADWADGLVTVNREQADILKSTFGVQAPVRTIYNAIDGMDRECWSASATSQVRLISDTGCSGRKGTHLLVQAVETLVEKGLPVTLTILGDVYSYDPQKYWKKFREETLSRHPDHFFFPGHVKREEIDAHLRAAHIYCSATLSEGCSLSRIRALTLGIPIVTTRCGALAEIVPDSDWVRFCPPGDVEALSRELERTVAQTLKGEFAPELERVQEWRRFFSPDRERREWREMIDAVLDGSVPAE